MWMNDSEDLISTLNKKNVFKNFVSFTIVVNSDHNFPWVKKNKQILVKNFKISLFSNLLYNYLSGANYLHRYGEKWKWNFCVYQQNRYSVEKRFIVLPKKKLLCLYHAPELCIHTLTHIDDAFHSINKLIIQSTFRHKHIRKFLQIYFFCVHLQLNRLNGYYFLRRKSSENKHFLGNFSYLICIQITHTPIRTYGNGLAWIDFFFFF